MGLIIPEFGWLQRGSATPRSAKLPGAPAGSNGEYEVDVAWTPALQELVLAACVYAFDNIPPQETEQLLMGLVRAAGGGDGEAERSLRKLAALSRQLEALGEADRRGAPQELVADEARTLRSQIRMWARTASGTCARTTRGSAT